MSSKEVEKQTETGPCPEGYKPARTKNIIREYAEVIISALILALIIRAFVIQAFNIPSGSMEPSLLIGDHLMVNKFVYGVKLPKFNSESKTLTTLIPVSKPKRGDVVVFIYPVDPTKDFIKRVIGVGGDVVEMRDRKLMVNGAEIYDEHGYFGPPSGVTGVNAMGDNFGPITVPENKLFVMGDNRNNSYDSRFWGFVDLKALKGKAMFIYWSWDAQNRSLRYKRVGEIIR